MTWPGRRDWTIVANTALLTPCLLDPESVRAIDLHCYLKYLNLDAYDGSSCKQAPLMDESELGGKS